MTIASLQRFMTLSILIFWWAWGAWLWNTEKGWALACLTFPLLITPFLLGIQCIWAAIVNRHDVSVRPANLAQWLGAWLAEWRCAALVFTWWQPFRHKAIANSLQPTPGKRGVVLVHGFFCNRALWTDWMRRLTLDKCAYVSVDLEPVFGSISDYAQIIEEAVAQVEKATGLPPILIGHSMGGLAIRAWAAKYIGHNGDMRRVSRIITLGTPHHGTAIAVASYGENGSQMHRGNAWLSDNAAVLPKDFAQFCTCYYSHCDNIVFPARMATFPGADNRHIAGHAHVQLAFSNDIQQACLGYLENGSCR